MSRRNPFSDPRTKREVIDKILSYDFEGDIREIGAGRAQLYRTSPQSFELYFPNTGKTFEFAVRIPRDIKEPAADAAKPSGRPTQTRSFAPNEDWDAPDAKELAEPKARPQRTARGRQKEAH